MVVKSFPPVEMADENGILAAGGDLDVETLILAYSNGIFPWPHTGFPLLWFAPPLRAVLFLDELHISKRLARTRRNSTLTFSMNTDFNGVISNCAASTTRSQRGTWITPEMEEAYCRLYEAGYAYSVEAYNGKRLVGGLYGVKIGKYWGGESMFFLERDASKLCFLYLMDHLKSEGIKWYDCQVINSLTESFGAREIPRDAFMNLLKKALS
ncbi:MAG: leucyl/phenylalanyl-tRNA--protein transferase [Candidatus Dadabacteria bacterium]|nr:MAG: leucyl/phenylalanyl-tRNA--protein transferase [Candidatus Dadabacteria bacterium]